MISIRTKRDVADAASQVRAFVFLSVNWAIHAKSSQALVEAVVESWQKKQPQLAAPYFIADVSEQCGEVWDELGEWLKVEGRPAGQLLMSGAGPLLLIHNAHVVVHAFPLTLGTEKLEQLCQSVWS
jgi:hypothetical protein